MRNCLKFDLGCGYRLITLRKEDCIHITYIGTHDECDRWLVNKKRQQPILWKSRSVTIEVPETEVFPEAGPLDPMQDIDADACEDFPPIEEKYLRMIFCGLIERPPEYSPTEAKTHPCPYDQYPL